MKFRLSSDEIKFITLFESTTGAKVKDCIQEGDAMGFLVSEGHMGLAIGKAGTTIQKIRKMFGRPVWVAEYSNDPKSLLKNFFTPVKMADIKIQEENGEKAAILYIRRSDRSAVIGHDGMRIRLAKKIVRRHANVHDILIRTTQN